MKIWLTDAQVALLRRMMTEALDEPWEIKSLQNDEECEAATQIFNLLAE